MGVPHVRIWVTVLPQAAASFRCCVIIAAPWHSRHRVVTRALPGPSGNPAMAAASDLATTACNALSGSILPATLAVAEGRERAESAAARSTGVIAIGRAMRRIH